MDITVGKVLSMVLFLVSISLSSILPLILARRKNRQSSQGVTAGKSQGQHIINACNSVAGGVLLATCFVALVPFVERSYLMAFRSRSEMSSHAVNYPYAEITILGGFFLVIFIEQLVTCQHQTKLDSENPSRQRSGRASRYAPEEKSLFSDEEEYTDYESHENRRSGAAASVSPSNNNVTDEAHEHKSKSGSGHSHNHLAEAKSLLHSVILVVTLGIHTLFEGMSIGLIPTVDLLVTLDIAVLLHAICCSVALGMNISQQKINTRSAVLVCAVFSLMMPCGIGLGLALGEIKGFGGLILTAILQGIATGTFVYVLFIEIIPSTMSESSGRNTMVQMLFMLAGCVLMTLIIVFSHHKEHGMAPPSSTTLVPFPNNSAATADMPS